MAVGEPKQFFAKEGLFFGGLETDEPAQANKKSRQWKLVVGFKFLSDKGRDEKVVVPSPKFEMQIEYVLFHLERPFPPHSAAFAFAGPSGVPFFVPPANKG